ncbi:MAG: hypothetical protein AAFX40_05535 [Cyanobacteria bacterium J06639_1]
MKVRLRNVAWAWLAIAFLASCGSDSTPIAIEPSGTVVATAPEAQPNETAAESNRVELLFDGDPEAVTSFDGAVALARFYLPAATDPQLANAAARLFGRQPRDLAVTPAAADVDFVNSNTELSLDDVAALLAAVPPLPAEGREEAIANRANALLGANRLQPNQIARIPGQQNDPELLPFVPNQPLDIIVQCEQTFADGQISQLAYFFDFREDGSVFGQFTTDSSDTISTQGTYTYADDRIEFETRGTYALGGQPREVAFTQGSNRILPRLGLVGYFDSTGTTSDIPLGFPDAPSPSTMRCITVGHRKNQPPTGRQRFECPDQPTAGGTFTNVFEFDTSPALPGSAFRQRDLYTGLSGVGDPDFIWRSDLGIYRQVGDLLYVDFSLPPEEQPSFPNFVTNVAQLRNGGTQLFVDEFPPGQQTCNRR